MFTLFIFFSAVVLALTVGASFTASEPYALQICYCRSNWVELWNAHGHVNMSKMWIHRYCRPLHTPPPYTETKSMHGRRTYCMCCSPSLVFRAFNYPTITTTLDAWTFTNCHYWHAAFPNTHAYGHMRSIYIHYTRFSSHIWHSWSVFVCTQCNVCPPSVGLPAYNVQHVCVCVRCHEYILIDLLFNRASSKNAMTLRTYTGPFASLRYMCVCVSEIGNSYLKLTLCITHSNTHANNQTRLANKRLTLFIILIRI